MTGTELRDLFLSSEFKQGLEELSSYLASIMQERPIVYLLAKCLWKKGARKFELENKRHDLSINDKRIEFKFNFDRCEAVLSRELERCGGNLEKMWKAVLGGKNKSWGVLSKICEDVCVREPKPNIFVWIICSRDSSNVPKEKLKRICSGSKQVEFNKMRPNPCELPKVDEVLRKLKALRPFSLLNADIQTKGDFPSTHHFRICDFTSSSQDN